MSEIYCCKECSRLFDEDTLYFLGTMEEIKNSFPDVDFPLALCYDHLKGIEGVAYRKFAHVRRRNVLTEWKDFSKVDSLFKDNRDLFLAYLFEGDVVTVNRYAACRIEILCDMLVEKTHGKEDSSLMFLKNNGTNAIEDFKKQAYYIGSYLRREGITGFCEVLGPQASIALVIPKNRDEAISMFKQFERTFEVSGTLVSYPPNYKITDLLEKYERTKTVAKPAVGIDELLRVASGK